MMSSSVLNYNSDLRNYLWSVGIREPEILKKLRIETLKYKSALMQICPEQGAFMANLVRIMGVNKAIEVGTYTGYSSLAVALALPEKGTLVACDVSEEWTSVAKRFWEEAGVAHKIQLFLAPAQETLQAKIDSGESGTFDFMFIDADKTNYEIYYEKGLQLLRKGGLIIIDNVLWSGAVINYKINDQSTVALRNLNNLICKDERVDISMVPIGDGLTLAVKR